ncbi:MAG: hypothetical protein J6S23_01615 [Clostridia bacterium]|nr:hypothetical protein [Clostridia bacterium]
MKRTELINTLEILKNDKGEQKGFSFRRTIKTLHEAKQLEQVLEFWGAIQNKGAEENGDGN